MIMVSACLLGINCKYNGENNLCPEISVFLQARPHIAICPETMGGLSTPRLPAEIVEGNAYDVLNGKARVINTRGCDVTANFANGAKASAELARLNGVIIAILKERSPSCGVCKIHDGSFSGQLVNGKGITAALLAEQGIEVISENEFLEKLFSDSIRGGA